MQKLPIANNLSLREQILQLMMIDIRYFETKSVEELPKELIELLSAYDFCGVILFAENVQDKNKTHALVNQIQTISKISKFIGLDEEGGVVSRLGDGVMTPGNMALGAINDITITENMGQTIGIELINRGINLNFAPVVDINSNPLNPVIGVRSFGSDKNLVTKHAKAFTKGLKSSGVISCLKHFPGHGDTITDTHHVLSIVDKSESVMIDNELYPYHELIKSDEVDMIMTAHLVMPQIDMSKIFASKLAKSVDTPATFSTKLLTNILRKQFDYQGVIISDALDMGAISSNFTQLEASIYALEAGVDILLMPFRIWDKKQLGGFHEYFELLYSEVLKSETLQKRVLESCSRVLKLKEKFLNQKITQDLARNDSLLIKNKGVTLFKNKILPWELTKQSRLLAIANNELILAEAREITRELGYTTDIINYTDNCEQILSSLEDYTHIVLYSYNLRAKDKSLQPIIDKLNQLQIPYVLISTRNPYDILYLDNVATNILIYGVSGFDQTNYQIKRFSLNLQTALKLVYTAKSVDEFNTFCPVEIN